jgi:hypothetical protein
MFAIGWLEVGEYQLAAKYFNQSYQYGDPFAYLYHDSFLIVAHNTTRATHDTTHTTHTTRHTIQHDTHGIRAGST